MVANRVYSMIAWKSHKRIIRIRVGQNKQRPYVEICQQRWFIPAEGGPEECGEFIGFSKEKQKQAQRGNNRSTGLRCG
jgi:hypothetical protein